MKITNLVWCLAVLFIAAQIGAQGTGLSVHSNPSGAQVTVSGDAQLAGVTPTQFQQRMIGQYIVTIKKSGYESHTTKVLLDPAKETVVEAQLTKKTSFKAGLRSMFIPGWGQYYSEKKPKAYLFAATTVIAGTAFLIFDSKFQDKFDTYEGLYREYNNANTVERRAELQAQYIDAQHEAYDAENVRRISIGVFAGVWALNVLDAIFFFPKTVDTTPGEKSFSIVPTGDFKTVGVKFNVAF